MAHESTPSVMFFEDHERHKNQKWNQSGVVDRIVVNLPNGGIKCGGNDQHTPPASPVCCVLRREGPEGAGR